MMRLLHKSAERGESREHLVTREEWEALFSPFPANVRYHMANLAAHNWEIVHDGERVAALAPTQRGHWMNLAGERTDITFEEWDAFYPRVPKGRRGGNGYAVHWTRNPDGSSGEMIVRQKEIVLPADATTSKSSSGTTPTDGGENG